MKIVDLSNVLRSREVNIAELGKEASKNVISEISNPLSRGPILSQSQIIIKHGLIMLIFTITIH